jgi:transcription elongation factor Elf1
VKRMVRGWREILGDWAQRCPHCGETWLVLGADDGDQHICKACGQSFRIQHRPYEGRDERERRCARSSGATLTEGVVN